ncbi:helix-turn-helix domain-containing protein [Endozoicomonas arenosclerae]|uniref:helix-turn-helix domain-containing protein n=1 Tax=Endozoicomonas arenosclerae TaxID=1633495 RepID=UPI0007844EF1|nr:helix-turn-helix domain-containing protein [Endozoicomonas arenosclerae]
MSTDKQINQEGLESSSGASPGEVLLAARQKAGLSVEQAADQLKVPESYILAIESNDFEKLPGLVFARGYVRSYARILELDCDAVVDHFDRYTGDSGVDTPHLKAGAPVSNRRPMSPALAWGATLLTVVLVGAGSYYGWNSDKRTASEPEAVSQQQAPVIIEPDEISEDEELLPAQIDFDELETEGVDPEVESEPESQVDSISEEADEPGLAEVTEPQVSVSPAVVQLEEPSQAVTGDSLVRLAIQFAEDCWVQIKDMSGNSLYTDVQKAGSNLDLEVPASVQVRFGNVNGVAELQFDGREVAVKAPEPGRKVASLVLEAG